MAGGRPFSVGEDAKLKILFCDDMMSMAMIARKLHRSEMGVRAAVARLGIKRSDAAFKAKWDERREAGKARMAALCPPTPFEPKDEQHWRLCLAHGGFTAFAEAWIGPGPATGGVTLSKHWRLYRSEAARAA
jgi:hypothetical protein